MKLHNNDFQKTKFLLSTLDPRFLTQETGIPKSEISKLKKRDNIESNTIEKFLKLKSRYTLKCIKELYYCNEPLPLNWENLTLINLESPKDLSDFLLLLKEFNNNPLMISRIEYLIKPSKPIKFIETLYSELFPHDQGRNSLRNEESLLLNKALISELCSKGSKLFNFYKDGESDARYDDYLETIENSRGAYEVENGPSPDEVASGLILNVATDIINFFRNQDINDYLRNHYEGRDINDDSVNSISGLIHRFNLSPEPFLLFDIINQYKLFLANPVIQSVPVTYSDGTTGYEEEELDQTIEYSGLNKYSISIKDSSPDFFSKLLKVGFTQEGDYLVLDFYKVS